MSHDIRLLRHERGFTLVELVIGGLIGIIVLLAMGSLYVGMVRSYGQTNTQTEVQRQGTLILEEFSRVILPSSGVIPVRCGPSTAVSSLAVQVPGNPTSPLLSWMPDGGFVCFYQGGNQIYECQFADPSATACVADTTKPLIGGAGTPYQVVVGMPTGVPPDPAQNLQFTLIGGKAVDVSFGLSADVVGPVTFGSRFSGWSQ